MSQVQATVASRGNPATRLHSAAEQAEQRRAFDADRDGGLNPAEYLAYEWAYVLSTRDVSNDGRVSEPEYIAGACISAEPVCVGLQHRRFAQLDRSRDGSIDKAEYAPQAMAWYVGDDRNRDCRITPPEGPEPLTKGPLWRCDPLGWLNRPG